jgi:hypothetical protein
MSTLPPIDEVEALHLRGYVGEGHEWRQRFPTLALFLIAREHFTEEDSEVFGYFARPHRSRDGQWWLVRGLLASDHGPSVVRLVSVQAWPWEPFRHDHDVTATLLREVPIAEIRNVAVASIRRYPRVAAELPPPFQPTREQERAAERAQPARRGRRPLYTDDDYRALALRYVELGKSGDREVRRTLAREYRVGEERIREWLRQARKRHFLAPTTQGRANFELGSRLQHEEQPQKGAHDA